MTISASLGFPRIGANRELKRAVEAYWKGTISRKSLCGTAGTIRKHNWQEQQSAGIDHIPSNDFSFYDHVLDTAAMLGAIPCRYHFDGEKIDLDTYFAMARGTDNVTPMEMTKWFDTNYHYIVPEFENGQSFSLKSTKIIDEFIEARKLGIKTRPVLLGPVSFLVLSKSKDDNCNPMDLIGEVIPVYSQVLSKLKQEGAEWVQIDEPVLA
ncbi:MAG: 5-methyltetrahydropteroyltriglutamate--homocysteine S-methyltransferase, partial [Phycisphaerales bacterium]